MTRRIALVLSEEPARIQAQEHALARRGCLTLVTNSVDVLMTWTACVHVDLVVADATIRQEHLDVFLTMRQDSVQLRRVPTLVLGALNAAECHAVARDPSVTVRPDAVDMDAFGAILADVLPLCA